MNGQQNINSTYIYTYVRTYIHTYVRTYMHKYLHTYIYTHIRSTYMHKYLHTYIHTYTHTHFDPRPRKLLFCVEFFLGLTQLYNIDKNRTQATYPHPSYLLNFAMVNKYGI